MVRREYLNSVRYFNQDGSNTRDNGPASIGYNGGICYVLDGKYFRSDGGPSVIAVDGTQYWWMDDMLYREMRPDGRILCFKSGRGKLVNA